MCQGETTKYMDEMTEKYGIRFIAKADIPVKGADCAPLDFYGFGYLKHEVEKFRVENLDQLWKKCQRVWRGIRRETCDQVYESWKKKMSSDLGKTWLSHRTS